MSAGDVMGLRFNTGGRVEPLVSNDDISVAVDDFAGNVGTARVRGHDRELVMFVDADRDASRAVNPAATQLRGDGWPVVGDALLVDVAERPLPEPLVDRYLDWDEPAAEPVRALEWDDHLDDLDRSDVGQFEDPNPEVVPAGAEPVIEHDELDDEFDIDL